MQKNNVDKIKASLCGFFLLPVLMIGCSRQPDDLSPLINEYKATYPTCDNKKACDELWKNATTWLENNSDLGLDIDTDELAQTHTLEMKNKRLVKVVDEVIYADERDRIRQQHFEKDENRGDYVGPEMKLIKRYIGTDNHRLELKIACEGVWVNCEESLLEQIRFNREMRGEDYPFPGSATEVWLLE